MRNVSQVIMLVTLMMGIVHGTGIAQEAGTHPIIEMEERITSTLDGNDMIAYAMELAQGQSVVVQLISDKRLSWHVTGTTDDRVLNGVYDEMTRVVAPTTDTYRIEIENPSDVSVAFALTLSPVEHATIRPGGIPYLLEDAPPILELNFEGEAGQFIRIKPSAVAFGLEQIDEDGVGLTIVPGPVAMISFDIGVVLPEDGSYRLVVEPEIGMPEFSDESMIAITEPEPLTGDIGIGETIRGEADNTLVEYTVELEAYQGIRTTAETDDGSQVFIYDADLNPVAFGLWHGMSAPTVAITDMIAPSAGDYTIRIVNPMTYDLFDGVFSLTVEELEVLDLSPERQRFTLGEDAILLATDIVADQLYQLTIEDRSDEERTIRIRLYELPLELFLSEEVRGIDGVEYRIEVEDAGHLVLVLEGLNRITAPVSVTFEVINIASP